MSLFDWILCLIPIFIVLGFSIYAQRFMKTVSDFLVAGRTGGRYLLTAANGITGIGVITFVSGLESYYQAGWAFSWWQNVGVPISLLLSLSGFVYYRYRQTRVLTLAQFFEVRYSRKYRIVMGLLCYLSGILNFGIFPAVSTQFFIDFLKLPPFFCNGLIPTYPALIILLLGTATIITTSGGQIQCMVTDTVQALFTYGISVAIGVAIVVMFDFKDFHYAVTTTASGMSMVNPFDIHKIQDFNFYFVAMNLVMFVMVYGSWQGSQGYSGAAINPHESKMAGILGTWRAVSLGLFLSFVALGAFTYLKLNPDFVMYNAAGEIVTSSRNTMVGAISEFLPLGMRGLFVALMFFFMLSTDTTYLHSWGTIFVQDVLLPCYGKPITPKRHLLLLRISIIFVAIFGFLFSIFYVQNDFILMFQTATGAFFTAAAGCTIIGGLYWSRGTKAGAWAALFVGVSISIFNLTVMDKRGWLLVRDFLLDIFPKNTILLNAVEKCPINGAYLGFLAILLAYISYIIVSFLSCRQPYNIDKLLHRKQFAEKDDLVIVNDSPKEIAWWKRVFLGFDAEFNLKDKILAVSVFSWTMFWFASFVIISIWNIIGYSYPNSFIVPWGTDDWFNWMMFYLIAIMILSPIMSVWLTYGGIKDMFQMFKLLRTRQHSNDSGFVEEPNDKN